jgi:hypothetical protein
LAQAGTLEQLALEVGQALQQLAPRLAPDQIEAFLPELGIGALPGLSTEARFAGAIATAVSDIGAAAPLLASLIAAISAGDSEPIISSAAQLIQKIGEIFNAFSNASAALHNAASAASGLTPAQIANLEKLADQLARRLVDYAIVEYLQVKAPGFVSILNLTGIIDDDIIPNDASDPTSPPRHARTLNLERIPDLFTKPQQYLLETFEWGSGTFDGTVLFRKLNTSFETAGLPCITIFPPGQPPIFDAFLVRMTSDTTITPPGLVAGLRIPATEDFERTYALTPVWLLDLSASARFDAGVQVNIKPPFDIKLSKSATISIQTTAAFGAKHTDGTPLVVFGQTGSSGLFAQSVEFGAGGHATFDASTNTATAEPVVTFKISGGKLVIDTSNADGFIADVTSGRELNATFDFSGTWAPETGLHLEGGAQLEIDLPVHLSLGPISVSTIYVIGGLSSGGLTLELSAALGVTLGPIQASVDRIGIQGLIAFPGSGGNLGPADLSLAFKPPNGLGIEIDAAVVVGGGYISFDPQKGQYAGVLEAAIVDVIQVKIIAVLDTILPDGSKGFSFLMIVTFNMPPIQLGFGFTLNGVGGLFGVNRTMSVDALRSGLRAHTLNSVLFPPDPIANAPQIISNVRSFFPPANGRFVFGPMLELGWGTPTLITMALGVILEVPDPVRLAIIGLIDAGLPSTDAALIELHIDVLGTVDFAAKKLAIDGTLFDSTVLIYALSGDLAMRLSWGSDPNFLFSLGGFNPHFNTAGLDLPPLKRMAVSIGDGDNPRISSNSYFAITSNTLQFGANNEAYASAGGFSVHGYLGFDVLVVYSPFSFTFDFKASFDVAVDGLTLTSFDVDGTFSGPRPWHLHAHVSIHLLFFDIGASLTLEWGDSTPVALPQRAVLPDLIPALQDARNWSAQLPDGARQAVSLVSPKPQDKTLRVHPMGTLTVRETVAPLDLPITRYAQGAPADGSVFAIGDVEINNNEEAKQAFQDYFATAQFVTLSDADKLSKPSFERYNAGVTIGPTGMEAGANAPRTVRYEERIIDVDSGFSRFTRIYVMPGDIHATLSRQGAGTQSAVKNGGLAKYRNGPAAAAITASDPSYVVAGIDDLAIRADIASAGGTAYFQAQAALATHLGLHPEDEGQLQIVPLHEVAA